jgi:hypothetical protein
MTMTKWTRAVQHLLTAHGEQTELGDALVAALLDVRLEGTVRRPCWCGKSQYPGAEHQAECQWAREAIQDWKKARKAK